MAAATQGTPKQFNMGGGLQRFSVIFSNMTSDQLETLSYNYASLPAILPNKVTYSVKVPPTARCGVFMACNIGDGSASAKTLPVRFYTEAGGDISGAEVVVELEFPGLQSTTAGITPV